MLKHEKFKGIVIKTYPWKEADKIIIFITPLGKIKAFAPGIRKITSKKLGKLELFSYVYFMLESRKITLIKQVELIYAYKALRSNLHLFSRGCYLLELFNNLLEEREVNYEIFSLLKNGLKILEKENNLDLILRIIEYKLISYLGYKPITNCCVVCKSNLNLKYFNPILGGILCSSCLRKNNLYSVFIYPETLNLLNLFAKADLNIKIKIEEEILNNLKEILQKYIQNCSPKKFNSLDFERNLKSV
ncbi:MAG: DNA repair protein RecO [Armatimonadetes bacterium]|nr:DNA repair protein RecO [Armatimonadota bacterium]